MEPVEQNLETPGGSWEANQEEPKNFNFSKQLNEAKKERNDEKDEDDSRDKEGEKSSSAGDALARRNSWSFEPLPFQANGQKIDQAPSGCEDLTLNDKSTEKQVGTVSQGEQRKSNQPI